jgi:hypothetical protein
MIDVSNHMGRSGRMKQTWARFHDYMPMRLSSCSSRTLHLGRDLQVNR